MSNKKVRRLAGSEFPYGKSILGSCGLIVAFMLTLGVIADPISGVIKKPLVAWFALASLPAAIAGLFYREFVRRRKRDSPVRERPNRRKAAGMAIPRMFAIPRGSGNSNRKRTGCVQSQ